MLALGVLVAADRPTRFSLGESASLLEDRIGDPQFFLEAMAPYYTYLPETSPWVQCANQAWAERRKCLPQLSAARHGLLWKAC